MSNANDTQMLNTGDFVTTDWTGATIPVDQDDELVGKTLNNTYVVERVLGEGGMGRVYEARHTRIEQKRVAVKVLHLEFARNTEVLARFQREAETAAAISHPNVVTVLDVDRTPQGLPYLVCEYLEGTDLSNHLKQVRRLDIVKAVYIARQLCKGLAAAHASNVVHRDLKPHNVFLVGDFEGSVPERPFVKILDFGLSRFLHTQDVDNQLTKTGYIMGTPAYMAPEQARGLRVDHRVDIYGVGAILYATLTGRQPFDEESPQATILAVMHSEPARPRSLDSSIPMELELVIERAMAKKPEDRYQDARALDRALEGLSSRTTIQVTASSTPPPQTTLDVTTAGPRSTLDTGMEDVHAARPRLVMFLFASILLLIAGAATGIAGVEQTAGYTFSRRELGLLLLAIVGTSLTPALLWVQRIRHRIWDNSSRVIVFLGHMRACVFTAVVTYGLFVLALHVVDDFLVRFIADPRLKPVGATWSGWNVLLPVISLCAALTVAWRRRIGITARPGFWRALSLWLVTSFALLLVGGIFYVGLRWRERTMPPPPAQSAPATPTDDAPAKTDDAPAKTDDAPAKTDDAPANTP
jgi:serine/threonine-protein kinase